VDKGVDWVQWLALAGGLAAVLTYVSGRLDTARSEAGKLFVLVTDFDAGPPPALVFTKYKVVNESDLPVSSVEVRAFGWGRRRVLWRFWFPDRWITGEGQVTGGYEVFNTIAPKTSTAEHQLPGLRGGLRFDNPPVVLIFRDGTGRRWVRWHDGKLSRAIPSKLRSIEAVGRIMAEALVENMALETIAESDGRSIPRRRLLATFWFWFSLFVLAMASVIYFWFFH
jgi:hypothetical protein